MELSTREIVNRINDNKFVNAPNAPFRYLPKCILDTARNNFIINGNSIRTLDYILNSFYIYRKTINDEFFAPHVLVNGAYEWPKNSCFEWSDMESVLSLGYMSISDVPGNNFHLNKLENNLFKYNIPNLSEVKLLLSNDWQNYSLGKYANPIKQTLLRFKNKQISREIINDGFLDYINTLDNYIFNF